MAPPVETRFPRPGSSLHLALRCAGTAQSTLLHWAHWWHGVSQIPYQVSDPSVAERKLLWWSQAVSDAFQAPAEHPLLRALQAGAPALDDTQVPPLRLWLEQIDSLRLLTQQTRWMSEATLLHHANGSTGAACEGACWITGGRDPATLALARRLGVGLRRAHILARLGQDTQAGWLHVPIDVLQQHEVRAHELLRPASAEPSPTISALLTDWRQRAMADIDDCLQQARQLPASERRALRPLVVLAGLHQALLDDLHRAGYPVLRQRLVLGPVRKVWVAQTTRWRWR